MTLNEAVAELRTLAWVADEGWPLGYDAEAVRARASVALAVWTP